MSEDYLFYDEKEKRYYFVGNSVCSQCGQPSYDVVRILILRNTKKSSLHIVCMNPKCANKVLSSDIHRSAIEHTKAMVIDEPPKGCTWIPFKRKFHLSEGRYENTYVAGEFNKNELCDITNNAWRSKKAEYSLDGASVTQPRSIDSNDNISYAELLEQEKTPIQRHELSKMLSNIAKAQKNAQLEDIYRLEEKEKQRRLI